MHGRPGARFLHLCWGAVDGDAFAMFRRVKLMFGDLSYAVLNACRAVRFATDGVLCSKLDGGQWMLARRIEEPAIQQALADQRQGRVRPITAEANRFVAQVLDELSLHVEHAPDARQ